MSGFGGLRPLIPAHQALEPSPEPATAAPVPTPAMTEAPPDTPPGTRLTEALIALRWTYGTLAIELRISPSTTRNWGLGRSPVPPALLAWLEDLAAFHHEHPAPPLKEREP
jgi:hypothetical protein